jgi:hypothetical protein
MNFHINFLKFHETVRVKLGYHKFCRRWVLKTLMGTHKIPEMSLGFVHLFWGGRGYNKDCNSFSVTWVSYINVEIKEQSKQWMLTNLLNKPKRFKQSLSARKLMAAVFWDRR